MLYIKAHCSDDVLSQGGASCRTPVRALMKVFVKPALLTSPSGADSSASCVTPCRGIHVKADWPDLRTEESTA